MSFSLRNYRSLKSNLGTRFDKNLKSTLSGFKTDNPTRIAQWCRRHGSELRGYSPLKWYFVHQLQNFLFFYEAQNFLTNKLDEFGDFEDEVFERWNKSEFADVFLTSLNKGMSFSKASKTALKIFDQHLVSLGDRQILKDHKVHAQYRPQVALGDSFKSGKLTRILETTLHLEGKELGLMTATLKEMKEFSLRIELALKVIRKFSPTSWERFVSFTDKIIPIHQKEFVSYSHQELPGVSMINLYDRDFVDLMDDLLHENGHHHLNHYLNTSKLIEEPLDEIYFSPWRRTPRPLRGIFHAYFTFFWAFKLFSDLAAAKDPDSIWYLFSDREKEKIYWRAVEEFHMLEYSFQDLKWARAQGLIKKRGWDLILTQRKDIIRFKKKIPIWEKKLRAHRKALGALKTELKIAAKDFQQYS